MAEKYIVALAEEFGKNAAIVLALLLFPSRKFQRSGISTYQWIIGLRPSNLLFSKLKEIGYEATGTIRKNKVERKCQLVPIKQMTKSSKRGDICAAVAKNTDRNEEVNWCDWKIITL